MSDKVCPGCGFWLTAPAPYCYSCNAAQIVFAASVQAIACGDTTPDRVVAASAAPFARHGRGRGRRAAEAFEADLAARRARRREEAERLVRRLTPSASPTPGPRFGDRSAGPVRFEWAVHWD